MTPPFPDSPKRPSQERLVDEMQFLAELCQVVAAKSELQPILDWIVHKTTLLLSADEGSIKLLGSDPAQAVAKTLVRRQSPGIESGSWPAPVSTSVMGYLIHRGEPLASPDLLDDERFPGIRGFNARVRSVLAVPLTVEGRITGMLAVTNLEPGRRWSPDETQLLTIVASNSAGVIEQARLRTEAEEKKRLEAENQRLERELDLAREIQMSLIPSGPLIAGGWEVQGLVVPARQVGGDAFDYYLSDDGRTLSLAIADVSGKGVPAALLMSNVQASLRAFCTGRHPIAEAIASVNRSVARSASSGKFITLFYGEMDLASGVLRFTNAGHNPPLLRRREGAIEPLHEGGIPLGLFESSRFEVGEVPFESGDSLLLYSDGISEAFDTRDEQFGEERLLALWKERGNRSPGVVIAELLAEVQRFRGSASQSDDMTAVVVGPRPAP
jgi:sigma-B regulation protein RsbU (phosphoserine phosphatase)